MALYDLHRSTADPLSTRLANVMVNAAIRMIDAYQTRRTGRALARLSDHELWDIGLDRATVERMSNRG